MSDLHGPHRLTLTVEETAELLGISRTCAYECIHRGEIPAHRFGRRIVIVHRELERLLGLAPRPDHDDR
jgi:excisionase family DNA binding protein